MFCLSQFILHQGHPICFCWYKALRCCVRTRPSPCTDLLSFTCSSVQTCAFLCVASVSDQGSFWLLQTVFNISGMQRGAEHSARLLCCLPGCILAHSLLRHHCSQFFALLHPGHAYLPFALALFHALWTEEACAGSIGAV